MNGRWEPALTTLIEDEGVAVPKGVELHGYDFHTVVYDVLEKLPAL